MNKQPYTVFYVVVCKDPTSPNTFLSSDIDAYHETVYLAPEKAGSFKLTKTSVPYLFVNIEQAEALVKEAAHPDTLNTKNIICKVVPIRIVESEWTPHAITGHNASILDARRIIKGMMHIDTVSKHVKKLAGKVLTILDAAYVNENQNKAVKDLVKGSFKSQLHDIWEESMKSVNECVEEVDRVTPEDVLS